MSCLPSGLSHCFWLYIYKRIRKLSSTQYRAHSYTSVIPSETRDLEVSVRTGAVVVVALIFCHPEQSTVQWTVDGRSCGAAHEPLSEGPRGERAHWSGCCRTNVSMNPATKRKICARGDAFEMPRAKIALSGLSVSTARQVKNNPSVSTTTTAFTVRERYARVRRLIRCSAASPFNSPLDC
jgi:hypothetical protein